MPARSTARSANPFDLGYLEANKEFEVWPENWHVIELFMLVDTQWRICAGLETGLDYTAVYPLLDRMKLEGDEWWQLLRDLQVMEQQHIKTKRELAK